VTRFDLELHVWEQADESLHAFFNYNTALFDEQTITRLLARFQLLLQEIVAAPDESLASYRLMTESERQRLLVAYNQDRTAYPRERAIHELFAEQAAAHPAAVAVVFADRQITYGELDGRADKLARYLRARGVGPETRVGLCVERSVEMLVGLLGILKAGGVYVPLDPDYPSERLRFIIADTSARLVLTQRHLAAALPQQSAEVVCLDSDWTPGTTESGAWVPPSVSGDNLAYIIYTSGSTGVPKGVGVAHRSVIRLVRATNYAAFGPGEVCLQFAPLSFDASTFEIWGALLNGGRLVVMPPGANALEEVAQSISRHRITTLWLTAGLFHLLVDRHVAALGGLRQLLAGGDVLSVPHVRKFLRAAPHCTLVNGYGPTENTTFTCCYRMTADTEINNSVPIGRPVSNTEVYVVDGNLEPVAEGIAGELLVGGDGLARGYYNRPELTAERFIPHPFSTEPGARLYRTGDLVRHLPDGHIEFLGRIDQQVKVRGFRIEPGEIEAALLSHKQVRAAAVIAEAENGTGKRLIAYVVAEGDAANGRELRRYLKERLPDYMIPAAFVALAGLPLTPNGKIDRRALPAPAPSGRDEEYVAPRTPVEEVVCGIWAEVLGVARVSIADNFFELGGHSLLATQVVSRVRATFGVDVPLRALFAAGTVSGLSEYVEQSLRARPAEQPPAIKPVSREQNLPLSYAQQRLWFLDQLEPGSAAFNISTAVRFVGQLDIVALERSFNEVVRRHESLRTTFVISGRQPVQLISPPRHLLLPVEDLSHLPESERETTVERLAAEEARRPFDLANDRLLRVRLLRLDADDHVVLLTMHHIISDGWSMGVLVSEVAALYGAFVAGDESPLEELPIQYADYALWQREWLTGEVLARQLDYWRAQLAQVSVLELPTDRPRPPVQSTSGARFNFRLSDTLAESLRALSRAEGATLFMTLLAAFDVLLYRYSGQTEFTVGTPVAGRTRVETEPLIGFFVNTLVLRARVQPEQTFRQLLAEVRRDALGAYAHQDVPFERVVEELQPERDLSRTPLFQTMFVLQNTPQETLALPGLALSSTSGYGGRVNFDLVLNMQDTAEGLQGFLEYNTDLYDAATAARIVGHFQTLLNGVAADPEQRVARLPLLTAAERRQLLEDWDATRAGFKPAECIQQMFTAQAERGPEAVAVRFQGEQLRYGELDARSNQLAHGLREVTETPRRCVAVMLDDARRQVIALLGVLKAGHHFVCLDAEHPVARLQQILAEVKPACLITEAAAIGRHAPWLKQFADESGVRLVSMDASDRFEAVIDGARWFTDCPAADPRIRVRSDDIAYIVYTSGSTGRPKGIVQTHGSFCQFAGWMSARFEMGPGQCIAQWAAITYDAAYAEIFSALASGATLCMATPSVKAEPQAVVEWLRDERVTLFQTVPSFAAQVLGVIEQLAARIDEEPLPHLEHVLLAGEVLPAKLARAWLALYPRRPVLYNLYGPTESILATYQVVDAACAGQASVPVGRAIDGRQILILDAAQQPCPVGVPGEIYIRSPYLTAGYFKRPQETQRRFLQNPLHDEYPDAVFRTGDLGRWRTDGSVEFFGRLDNQVKVRGMRLELEELEAALARHERVTECAVALVAFGENDQRLVAYVVTAGDVSAQALRSSLETAVPAGLLPAHFVFLERLPRTASGKIARAELPPPDAQQADENGNAYLAPRTPLEASIAAVWREFLAVERVGVGDNFFHLGGHSLLATQVINRLRQQHAIELPLRAFMESPTVAGLARSIEGAQRAPAPAAAHLASLLEQVKSLSDEEVRALLSQRQSSAPQDLS
jgi:amino acid adenylation domain-containing protein